MYKWKVKKLWKQYHMDILEWVKHLKEVGYDKKEIKQLLKNEEFKDDVYKIDGDFFYFYDYSSTHHKYILP